MDPIVTKITEANTAKKCPREDVSMGESRTNGLKYHEQKCGEGPASEWRHDKAPFVVWKLMMIPVDKEKQGFPAFALTWIKVKREPV